MLRRLLCVTLVLLARPLPPWYLSLLYGCIILIWMANQCTRHLKANAAARPCSHQRRSMQPGRLGSDCARLNPRSIKKAVERRPSLPQPPSHPTTAGGGMTSQISGSDLPPQLTLGVSLKAPPALGPWRMPRSAQRHHPWPRRRGSPRRCAGRGSVTMAMGGGPSLHRRPRGAGAAETTSWAVGGAPHMSPTPIWLVGIVARRPSGRRG
eukprot:COSAG01_NODE_1699_length_9452_cov_47.169251_6_plen_209_part_00